MIEKYFLDRPHLINKCSVDGCDGFGTTTNKPNLILHILRLAKSEIFKKQFFPEIKTPHFDYVKRNATIEKEEKIIMIISK